MTILRLHPPKYMISTAVLALATMVGISSSPAADWIEEADWDFASFQEADIEENEFSQDKFVDDASDVDVADGSESDFDEPFSFKAQSEETSATPAAFRPDRGSDWARKKRRGRVKSRDCSECQRKKTHQIRDRGPRPEIRRLMFRLNRLETKLDMVLHELYTDGAKRKKHGRCSKCDARSHCLFCRGHVRSSAGPSAYRGRSGFEREGGSLRRFWRDHRGHHDRDSKRSGKKGHHHHHGSKRDSDWDDPPHAHYEDELDIERPDRFTDEVEVEALTEMLREFYRLAELEQE